MDHVRGREWANELLVSINNGKKNNKDVMKNIFSVLNQNDEDRSAFMKMLLNWIKCTTSAMELMIMMETGTESDTDSESDGESSTSDESNEE